MGLQRGLRGRATQLLDAPGIEVGELLLVDAGDVRPIEERDVVLLQRPLVILDGARASNVGRPLLHAFDGKLRNVLERFGLDCDAMLVLDLALGAHSDRRRDGLVPLALLRRSGDPLATNLESSDPDLAVRLKVDVQCVVYYVPVDQFAHRGLAG